MHLSLIFLGTLLETGSTGIWTVYGRLESGDYKKDLAYHILIILDTNGGERSKFNGIERYMYQSKWKRAPSSFEKRRDPRMGDVLGAFITHIP